MSVPQRTGTSPDGRIRPEEQQQQTRAENRVVPLQPRHQTDSSSLSGKKDRIEPNEEVTPTLDLVEEFRSVQKDVGNLKFWRGMLTGGFAVAFFCFSSVGLAAIYFVGTEMWSNQSWKSEIKSQVTHDTGAIEDQRIINNDINKKFSDLQSEMDKLQEEYPSKTTKR